MPTPQEAIELIKNSGGVLMHTLRSYSKAIPPKKKLWSAN